MNNRHQERTTLEQLVSRLNGDLGRLKDDGTITIPCPCHKDDPQNPQPLRIKAHEGFFYVVCYANCRFSSLHAALGGGDQIKPYSEFPGKEYPRAEYLYFTERDKRPAYRAVRVERPGGAVFYQERPVGSRWLDSVVRPIPYRLPEISAAPKEQPIIWAEDEATADHLASLGLRATAHPGGWTNEDAIQLVAARLAGSFSAPIIIQTSGQAETVQKRLDWLSAYSVSLDTRAMVLETSEDLDTLTDGGELLDQAESASAWAYRRIMGNLARIAPDQAHTETPQTGTYGQNVLPNSAPADNPLLNWRMKFSPVPAARLAELPPVKVLHAEITERSVLLTYGDPGSGKTFLSLYDALRIAQTRNVVLVLAETSQGIWSRIEALCRNLGLSHERLYVVDQPLNLMRREEVDTFIAAINYRPDDRDPGLQPAYIVLDTLASCVVGFDGNSDQAMSVAMDAARRIANETGAAVDLIHHKNKAGSAYRGSTVLEASADCMREVSNTDGKIRVKTMKFRHGPKFPDRVFHLRPDGDSAYLASSDDKTPDAVAAAHKVGDKEAQVLDVLAMEQWKNDPATYNVVKEVLRERSQAQNVYETVDRLVKKGMVIKKRGGVIVIVQKGSQALAIYRTERGIEAQPVNQDPPQDDTDPTQLRFNLRK